MVVVISRSNLCTLARPSRPQLAISVPTPTVPLPEVQLAEWNAFGTGTAVELFTYGQHQAMRLLEFPDYSDGDLSPEQRREAFANAVTFRRPLPA